MMSDFRHFLEEDFEGSIEDLAEHGADAGFPGLSYYSDTIKLYEKYEREIWEALDEDADGMGSKNILDFIGTLSGADNVADEDQFKNLLVWYMAERTARQVVDEREDDGYYDEDED